MRHADRESWLGLTPPNFRHKFVFQHQESAEAFYFGRFEPTPSELDGLPEADEDRARSLAARMLAEAGVFLRLPVTTVVAAQTILQFFYMRESLLRHDFRDVAMGALFLAAKSEETIRWSGHVALVFDQVFKVRPAPRRSTSATGAPSASPSWAAASSSGCSGGCSTASAPCW